VNKSTNNLSTSQPLNPSSRASTRDNPSTPNLYPQPMPTCLCCHRKLNSSEKDYHTACATDLFGDRSVPVLDQSNADIEQLAAKWLHTHSAVTGVQPKLSLHWTKKSGAPRLTIVGTLEGQFILKTPYDHYPHMPELEALCMNMARACGIPTVPFGLIRLQDGALAYITHRIDRSGRKRIAMEDMCQLSERQTEHKYHGSHEQIAKLIAQHSNRTLLDLVRYYEVVLFSFLIGNNDMHLKNFSLFAPTVKNYELAPAYDLLATALLLPSDKEELALNLNGKKKRLKRIDFETAMAAQLPEKIIANLFERIANGMKVWPQLVRSSYVPASMKAEFPLLLLQKRKQLGL